MNSNCINLNTYKLCMKTQLQNTTVVLRRKKQRASTTNEEKNWTDIETSQPTDLVPKEQVNPQNQT
jgi:hypothetical protein